MKKHTSYRGQKIDMELLKFQNEKSVALGNAKMNARGDILGRGGIVVKTREELLAEKERELQKPDFIPVHTSHSVAPKMDEGLDDFDNDNDFDVSPTGAKVQEKFTAPAPVEQEETTAKRAPRKVNKPE